MPDVSSQEGLPAGASTSETKPGQPEGLRQEFFQQTEARLTESVQGMRGIFPVDNGAGSRRLAELAGRFFEGRVSGLLTAPPSEREGEVLRQIHETGLRLGRGFFAVAQGQWPEELVSQYRRINLPPEETASVLEGYTLAALCARPKAAFEAMRKIAELEGSTEKAVIERFLPFIQEVRDTVSAAEAQLNANNKLPEGYPLALIPSSHRLTLDNQMKLAEFWPAEQGKYSVPSTPAAKAA